MGGASKGAGPECTIGRGLDGGLTGGRGLQMGRGLRGGSGRSNVWVGPCGAGPCVGRGPAGRGRVGGRGRRGRGRGWGQDRAIFGVGGTRAGPGLAMASSERSALLTYRLCGGSAEEERGRERGRAAAASRKLPTFLGVVVPTLLSMFSVVLFLRLGECPPLPAQARSPARVTSSAWVPPARPRSNPGAPASGAPSYPVWVSSALS